MINFDFGLTVARVIKGISVPLLATLGVGAATNNWEPLMWSVSAAALTAIVIDVDAFIKAREQRILADDRQDAAVRKKDELQRLRVFPSAIPRR